MYNCKPRVSQRHRDAETCVWIGLFDLQTCTFSINPPTGASHSSSKRIPHVCWRPLKIKITSVFCFFLFCSTWVYLYKTLVWQEAFPRDITSVIVNIHLRQIKGRTGAKSTEFWQRETWFMARLIKVPTDDRWRHASAERPGRRWCEAVAQRNPWSLNVQKWFWI